MNKEMKITSTRGIVFIGLFVGLAIILTRFVQIPFTFIPGFNDRISLGFLPVALSGTLFGPAGGALVGGLEDLIRALIFPQGDINLLFTLNAALRGVIYGLFLRKMNIKNIIIASLIIFALNNTLIISAIIHLCYGAPFIAAITGKVGVSAINCVVQIIVLIALGMPIERTLKNV
ncbi:MAG: folate family ECF transporter S component [Clostridia bacterium]|nr:folate family ECF transporter S component [Clostridia bacterium]